MPTPREYYKQTHPDLFSDSVTNEFTELDRSLLEFHLSSITTRSQEADFESFARKLCEKEVCPNLIPQTGPTGGGDAKVDSETFPVADKLAELWYVGMGNEAAQEKWAVAISAKAKWKPKCESDIKKISETNRGYKKAFFITNQPVPSKTRVKTEEDLSKQYGLEVHIFDRNWILERIFAGGHQDIAIKELKVTGLKRSHQVTGPNDTARLEELASMEAALSQAASSDQFDGSVVDTAIAIGDLARQLEKPRPEVEGIYARAIRLANKYGTRHQKVEAAYDWAWTLIWWYEDWDQFQLQYDGIESLVDGSQNVTDWEWLSNLWHILMPHIFKKGGRKELKPWFDQKTSKLRSSLTELSKDKSRPSSCLLARSLLAHQDFYDAIKEKTDPSFVFDNLRAIIEEALGLVGFPFQTIAKVIEQWGAFIPDNAAFDVLFERLIELSSKRDGDVKAARLLLRRAAQLMGQKRPAKAIAFAGQALGRLYKHETRTDLIFALRLCGNAYLRLGLLWAARGTYLSAITIASNDFWQYETITKVFVDSVNNIKRVELMLGRIPQFLCWHELDLMLRNRWEQEGEEIESYGEIDSSLDLLLARHFMRVPDVELPLLERLPDELHRLWLPLSKRVVLFLLGYPEEFSEDAKHNSFKPDEAAYSIWKMKADVDLPDVPNLGNTLRTELGGKVIGCHVSLEADSTGMALEIGEAVLSSLQSFVSTTAIEQAFSFEPKVSIDVQSGEPGEPPLSTSQTTRHGRPHIDIVFKELEKAPSTPESYQTMRDEIFKASLLTFAHIARFKDDNELQRLFAEERVGERAAAFVGTVGNIENVLGSKPKLTIQAWSRDTNEHFKYKRETPWKPSATETKASPPTNVEGQGYCDPGSMFNADKVSHDRIDVISPIRMALWDKAGWNAILYITHPLDYDPPIIGLMFRDAEVAKEIFENWVRDYGAVDDKNQLRVTIVKGIDRSNPYAYRVLIGENPGDDLDKNRLLMSVRRVIRMDPTDSVNLGRFIKSYLVQGKVRLIPAIWNGVRPEPIPKVGIMLLEFHVRDAWQIGRHDEDMVGIVAGDDVIIPADKNEPPVLELLEYLKNEG